MLRFPFGGCLPLTCAALFSPAAVAHGGLDIGAFYAGGVELVLHWQQALFMLAAAAWCAQQAQPGQLWLGSCLVGGFMAGATAVAVGVPAPLPMLQSAVGYTLVGAAVAAGLQAAWRWLLVVAVPASVISGMGLAAAALPDIDRPGLYLLGTLAGAALLLFYLTSAAAWLPAGWLRVALRVAGSWTAAIGLMVCAFSIYQPA